ncbi:MAG: phosphoenolpyruvate carboxylase, partial [Pirellulaceae bacterium]
MADIQVIYDSLNTHHSSLLAQSEIQRWLDLAQVFGLHMTRLDVRQDARRYREILGDILSNLGVIDGFADLDESQRCRILAETMPWREPIDISKLAPLTVDTLELFRSLHTAQRVFGPHCLGAHIISLTQCPS